MIDLTLEALNTHLNTEKYKATIQNETEQVASTLVIDGREYPLFLRIFEESDLLQLIIFIPAQIKEGTEGDLARILHLINKELDIPGFGLDEQSGVVFYRLMLPSKGKKIDQNLLNQFLQSMELVCKNFAPVVMAIGSGMTTYEDVLKKVQS